MNFFTLLQRKVQLITQQLYFFHLFYFKITFIIYQGCSMENAGFSKVFKITTLVPKGGVSCKRG